LPAEIIFSATSAIPKRDVDRNAGDGKVLRATAKDADYIIYNSTIGGELQSLNELLAKNELLTDFKAVQNGDVWCTNRNLFQETTQLGSMIMDMHRMLTEPDETTLNYLYKLQ
jgi:iron complex transport system substrate-binding protein